MNNPLLNCFSTRNDSPVRYSASDMACGSSLRAGTGKYRPTVADGKNDKAQDIYKTLKTQEDKGHDKYTE